MAAVLVDVADGVKTELDGAALSQSITPQRSYADWDLELTDADTLQVDVVPVGTPVRTALETRGGIAYTCSVDIAVRKRFDVTEQDATTGRIDVAEVDALVLLVEEINELFIEKRLTSFDAAVWQQTEIRAAFDRRHLKDMRQFTGVVRVTYRVDKALP